MCVAALEEPAFSSYSSMHSILARPGEQRYASTSVSPGTNLLRPPFAPGQCSQLCLQLQFDVANYAKRYNLVGVIMNAVLPIMSIFGDVAAIVSTVLTALDIGYAHSA